MPSFRRWRTLLYGVLGLAIHFGLAGAEPHTPQSDNEILERLPTASAERRELRALRAQLETEPGNERLALSLARRYLEIGRRDSDPRYYGHAETLLEPWAKTQTPWPEALLLRATVLQNRHAFEPALADLNTALRLNPRYPEAWLTRAAVQEARGDYAGALKSCLGLLQLASDLVAEACVGSALSLSGQGEYAYRRLRTALEQSAAAPQHRLWALGILAELAERLGRDAEAEGYYRSGLALGIRSAYLLAAYGDFLLDRGRPGEAVKLLAEETRADPLLLRLALAERQTGEARFQAHAEALESRFAAGHMRGDSSHQGDEARFQLKIRDDPAAALRLARGNWQTQREPRDARILLEAALAAGQPEAAQPVAEFLHQTHLEDARLQSLLARLGSG